LKLSVFERVEKIEPTNLVSSWKRAMMELPIIDGFNSHLRIVQDWMPRLSQTLGMAEIARFDRCRSCHQNIDKTTSSGGMRRSRRVIRRRRRSKTG
jgi:hypothetical protein